MTAPTCRWRGDPIRKRTRKVFLRRKIGPNDREISGFVRHLAVGDDWPKTMADCQRLTNQRVVSIQYSDAPARRPSWPTHRQLRRVGRRELRG